MTEAQISSSPFSVSAADGYWLKGVRFAPAEKPKAVIVVAGATAVPQRFYKPFAQHLARCGYAVLTFDYRGVGRSAPKDLRGFRMDFLDWGRLDLAAVIREATDPDLPLFLVGHSYGGMALGLLPEDCRVDALYAFGMGAGWHGWMPRLERLRVLMLWRVVGPLMVRWKGFLPFRLLGLGEDLPIDVFRQWGHWCRFPHFFFDDPEARPHLTRYATLTTPITALNALDDKWATPASRNAFAAGFGQAPIRRVDFDAKAAGMAPIGHVGYFRPQAQALWDDPRDWFDAQTAAWRRPDEGRG
ncbi:MAG: alpha/beta fold hydrolase [Elsteraceae bacterium]